MGEMPTEAASDLARKICEMFEAEKGNKLPN